MLKRIPAYWNTASIHIDFVSLLLPNFLARLLNLQAGSGPAIRTTADQDWRIYGWSWIGWRRLALLAIALLAIALLARATVAHAADERL